MVTSPPQPQHELNVCQLLVTVLCVHMFTTSTCAGCVCVCALCVSIAGMPGCAFGRVGPDAARSV